MRLTAQPLDANVGEDGGEGVEVSVMPRAQFLSTIAALRFSIGFSEAPTNLDHYLQGVDPPLTVAQLAPQAASPDVRQLFFGFFVPGAPLAVTPQGYEAGLEARARLRVAYQSVMMEHSLDAVVFPTTLIAPGLVGQEVVTLPGGPAVPATIAYTQNVVPASYAGLAGLSLPVGLTHGGLPSVWRWTGWRGATRRCWASASRWRRRWGAYRRRPSLDRRGPHRVHSSSR